jgi:hypothetical protein
MLCNISYAGLACILATQCTFAADRLEPGCLVFIQASSAADQTIFLEGTLANHCGKPVTAYALSAELVLRDGSSTTVSGAAEDFIWGASATPAGVPAGGVGPVQPDESRPSAKWPMTAPPNSKMALAAVIGRVSAVIFDDSTAVGDDKLIDTVFVNRRDDLREALFWQEALARFKGPLAGEGPLKRLIDLADVPERERTMKLARKPLLISSHAAIVAAQLEWLDGEIDRGRLTRGEATAQMEKELARQVTVLTTHVERRKN